MELARDHYACERCGDTFRRRHRVGRRPHYCSRTCRQRAYEARRRGAEHHRLPTPELAFILPDPARPDQAPGPHCYEPGRGRTRTHALRPDGPPDRNDGRPTLCGATARALPIVRRFGQGAHRLPICHTCDALARRHPLPRPVQPSADLARLKHLLRNARRRARRGDPVAQRLLVERLYLLTA